MNSWATLEMQQIGQTGCVYDCKVKVNRLCCCRVWPGLVLAAFFNLQSRLYYELLGNFMGKGDKETFALGLAKAGLPYHIVDTPVGSVGFNQRPFG